MTQYLAIYTSTHGKSNDDDRTFHGESRFWIFEAESDAEALTKAKGDLSTYSFENFVSLDKLARVFPSEV